MEKKFNLCDEKWILVRDKDCNIVEVSLKDALLNAHRYECLCGELPTQDVAVLRLLLAVLHTVFSRVDVCGNEIELEDEEDAFEQWKSIWECGRMPEKPIVDYLEKWYDRFWLIHPERPFYQVAGLKNGTEYLASKLNAEISKSNNIATERIFAKYDYKNNYTLSFGEASRWLVCLNAFDDTGAKKPSPKPTWCSTLGIVYNNGSNLFETLMLNLVMVNNGRTESKESPVWERNKNSNEANTLIPRPDNLASLYTVCERKIFLKYNDADRVTGYLLTAGDYFDGESDFFEPMTIWNEKDGRFFPKKYDISKQQWREFGAFFPENTRVTAGVVIWMKNYCLRVLRKPFTLRTSSVSIKQKKDPSKAIVNTYSDSLSMSAGILSEKGGAWRKKIQEQVEKCDELSKKVFTFAQNVNIANGGDSEDKTPGTEAKTKFYYMLDLPFRKWLESINPDDEDADGKLDELKNAVRTVITALEEEYSNNSSPTAIVGRAVNEKDKKVVYSVPKACNKLNFEFNKLYANVKEGEQ